MKPGVWISGALVIAGLAVLPFVASTFVTSLALSIAMYAGLALSWAMFSGATGYVALSTSAFFGLGAYACAILLYLLPWPAVIVCGALTAVALALLLGLCVLHLRGTYFAILTFGISELLKNSIMYVEKSQFGTVGRLIIGAPSLKVIYWTVLALAVLAAAIYWIVARSNFGAAMRAIGSDEARAATLGLNVRNIKIAGFCLSALIPGAIGAAVAVRWTYIDPQIVFNPFIVFQTVLIASIGGPTRLA
jgi:branched-chain amino acid transport system permease protein